jgi:hypothetical protein
MTMRYKTPIKSIDHAIWCHTEAERRYKGVATRDPHNNTLVVRDEAGVLHSDRVLRALSMKNPLWRPVVSPASVPD